MSVRVGHIMRHKDVHGVSGTGKVADVFEATNGKCVVVWISAHASVNVYDHIKDVETTHSHGGKTLVKWDYESPPEPDPMEEILGADKPELTEEEVEQLADETAEAVSQIAATKVAEKMAEKVAEKAAEQRNGTSLEDLEEEPDEDEEIIEEPTE
ncbi:hypothetical protein LCGC14_2353310, partial [marine sediment metagenome]